MRNHVINHTAAFRQIRAERLKDKKNEWSKPDDGHNDEDGVNASVDMLFVILFASEVFFRFDFTDNTFFLIDLNIDFRNTGLFRRHWKSSSFFTEGIRLYTTRLMMTVMIKTRIPITAAIL